MVSLGRVLEGVLVKVFSAAPELGQGGQLEHGHRPLKDGDRLLMNAILLRFGSSQISRNNFLGGLLAVSLDRAVVFTAPAGN
jgi:hypothetical protein